MTAFFEARVRVLDLQDCTQWVNEETAYRHALVAPGSFLSLQKRAAYPRTFLVKDGPVFLMGYADTNAFAKVKEQGALLTHGDLLANLDQEFLVVVADTKTGSIRVMRDANATMPLFVYMDDCQLAMSNEYSALLQYVPKRYAEPTSVLGSLLTLPRERPELVQGTLHLGQVEQLRFSAQAQEVTEAPLTDLAFLPDAYDSGAPRLFKAVLEDRLDAFWQDRLLGQNVGFELSGGFDSAMITGYFARGGLQDMKTFTLTHWGEDEVPQSKKVQALVSQFGLANYGLSARLPRYLPTYLGQALQDFLQAKTSTDLLYDDYAELIARHGIQVMVTGIGGNEMCTIFRPEPTPLYAETPRVYTNRLDLPGALSGTAKKLYGRTLLNPWQRRGVYIPLSVADAFRVFFNAFIRKGIWPVTPFASPKFLYFMRHIEPKYLYERRIVQAYLAAYNFPPELYNRDLQANHVRLQSHYAYADFEPTWKECLASSVLVKSGYAAHGDAGQNWQRACSNNEDAARYKEWIFRFVELERRLHQWGVNLTSIM